MPRPGRLRIVGGLVITLDRELGTIDDGEVTIEGDRIVHVGRRMPSQDDDKAAEAIDARGAIVLPGLVNAHTHSYGVYGKGSVDKIPLDLFIPRVTALGDAFEDEDIYLAAALTAVESLKAGTTCLFDHLRFPHGRPLQSVAAAIQAYLEVGIRATVAPMFGDRSLVDSLPETLGQTPPRLVPSSVADVDAYFGACAEAVSRWHGAEDRIQVFLGTDGPQRCSMTLLERSRAFLDAYPVGMQSHVLETLTQHVRGMQLYGRSLVAVLEELGLLGPRLSLVHFVWSDDNDHARVASAGAAVVHCPGVNLQLGSGIAPVLEMLAKGIPVALGTDGANSLDLGMFTQIKLALLIHRVTHPWYHKWIGAEEVFRMATEGGAEVHGMRGEIGVLRPGARADVTLLDRYTDALSPTDEPLLALATRETGSSVRTVIVGGQVVLRDRRCTRVDEDALLERLVKRRRALEPVIAGRQSEILATHRAYLEAMYQHVMRTATGDTRLARPPAAWPQPD